MAHHAGRRQAVVASNIANADTPDFKAMQIASFKDAQKSNSGTEMLATRAVHHRGKPSSMMAEVTLKNAEPAPNGNTVSIEEEILDSVAVSREHSRALAIYRHGMTVIRATMGR